MARTSDDVGHSQMLLNEMELSFVVECLLDVIMVMVDFDLVVECWWNVSFAVEYCCGVELARKYCWLRVVHGRIELDVVLAVELHCDVHLLVEYHCVVDSAVEYHCDASLAVKHHWMQTWWLNINATQTWRLNIFRF